jgi:hypothetical protein
MILMHWKFPPDGRLLRGVRMLRCVRDIELELQNCWFLLVAMYFAPLGGDVITPNVTLVSFRGLGESLLF